MDKYLITGLFQNSQEAGEAVSEIKSAGLAKDISVVAKNWDDSEPETHTVEASGTTGGVTGAVVGALAGLLIGASAVVIPGVGPLVVAGPFTALMTAAGALTGGLIGFLVDAGIPEKQAKIYEEAIQKGEVLVAIYADSDDESKVQEILRDHDAREIYIRE